eukprot:6171958-Pleurochrysis_carterae.AAC.2
MQYRLTRLLQEQALMYANSVLTPLSFVKCSSNYGHSIHDGQTLGKCMRDRACTHGARKARCHFKCSHRVRAGTLRSNSFIGWLPQGSVFKGRSLAKMTQSCLKTAEIGQGHAE